MSMISDIFQVLSHSDKCERPSGTKDLSSQFMARVNEGNFPLAIIINIHLASAIFP